jgi:hypothetical protein
MIFLSAFMETAVDDDDYAISLHALSNPPSSLTLASTVGICQARTIRKQREVRGGRAIGYHEVTVPWYTPDSFRSHFRMSRTAFEVICPFRKL